ncbi:MAG: glycosyltransferase [Pseudomonadota bacterium]
MALDSLETLPPKTVQKQPIVSRIGYAIRAALSAIQLRPDLIYCNHLFMAPLSVLLAGMSGAKLVVQLHGTEVWPRPSALQIWALRRADLLICVSRDTHERIGAHLIDCLPSISVVGNTVDDVFRPGNKERAREKFSVKDNLTLLTVGRLDDRGGYKGHDRVIRALKSLEGSFEKDLLYLIAGEGKDRSRLEKLCRDLKLEDRVRFLGNVPFKDLPDLYRASDLFVMPSTGEGFGIVYIEAMACGTPAMGLDVGGVRDALDDGKLGLLLSEQDDLAVSIRDALSDPPSPFELSDRVIERFGRHAFQEHLLQTLQEHDLIGQAVSA